MSERTFTNLPEGWYNDARMIRQTTENGEEVWVVPDETPGTGSPYYRVKFEIIVNGERHVRTGTWYTTDKAIGKTVEKLMECGWSGHDFRTIDEEDLGGTIGVKIVHETSKDGKKTYDKVAFVSSGGGGVIRSSVTDRQSFAAKMNARMRSAGVGNRTASPNTRPIDDDDQPPF